MEEPGINDPELRVLGPLEDVKLKRRELPSVAVEEGGPAGSIRLERSGSEPRKPASPHSQGFASRSALARRRDGRLRRRPEGAEHDSRHLTRTPALGVSKRLDHAGHDRGGPDLHERLRALARTLYSPSPRAPVSAVTAADRRPPAPGGAGTNVRRRGLGDRVASRRRVACPDPGSRRRDE